MMLHADITFTGILGSISERPGSEQHKDVCSASRNAILPFCTNYVLSKHWLEEM